MRIPLSQDKDTTDLQAHLLAPTTCTLSLTELLRLKLKLWMNVAIVACYWNKQGVLANGYNVRDILKSRSKESK